MHNKTNIYAVARRQLDAEGTDSYDKSQQHWSIVVESHPMLGIGRTETIEYKGNADGVQGTSGVQSHDNIIGSILIADSHVATKSIRDVMQKRDQADSGYGSEDWLKSTLQDLKEAGSLPDFSLTDFMAYADSYVSKRQSEASDTPATVAYPDLHPDHKEKAKKHGFWVGYPEGSQQQSGNQTYGGLM